MIPHCDGTPDPLVSQKSMPEYRKYWTKKGIDFKAYKKNFLKNMAIIQQAFCES